MIEETGETVVGAAYSLQLWSVNGSLLACTPHRIDARITALTLLGTPEWLVEALPMAATGHADGTVRFWAVREPTQGAALGNGTTAPRALSSLPVPSVSQPAWELYELGTLRLDAHATSSGGVTGGSGAGGATAERGTAGGGGGAGGVSGAAYLAESELAVTALCVGEGFERLLWTATADGKLRSWRAPPAPPASSASASLPTLHAAGEGGIAVEGNASPSRERSASMEGNPPPPSPLGPNMLSTEMGA